MALRKNITGHLRKDWDVCWPQGSGILCWFLCWQHWLSLQSTKCPCGRDAFVFIFGGIALSGLETLWAISFLGAKRRGREQEESTHFVANILTGFCFLSDFHMSVYSCLCSPTWMPGFDLRTNCPINSWMSEFNLHLSLPPNLHSCFPLHNWWHSHSQIW